MVLSPTFRAQFSALTEAEVLTVLGWLLEPAVNDPEPEMSDALIDALAPVTKAYTEVYDVAHRIVTGEFERDRLADEADYRYEMRRDAQLFGEGGLAA